MGNAKKVMTDIAEVADIWRLIPRLLLVAYAYLVWDMYSWFTSLQDPSTAQATFVSVIIGAASVVTGVYFKSGIDWKEYRKRKEDNTE